MNLKYVILLCILFIIREEFLLSNPKFIKIYIVLKSVCKITIYSVQINIINILRLFTIAIRINSRDFLKLISMIK